MEDKELEQKYNLTVTSQELSARINQLNRSFSKIEDSETYFIKTNEAMQKYFSERAFLYIEPDPSEEIFYKKSGLITLLMEPNDKSFFSALNSITDNHMSKLNNICTGNCIILKNHDGLEFYIGSPETPRDDLTLASEVIDFDDDFILKLEERESHLISKGISTMRIDGQKLEVILPFNDSHSIEQSIGLVNNFFFDLKNAGLLEIDSDFSFGIAFENEISKENWQPPLSFEEYVKIVNSLSDKEIEETPIEQSENLVNLFEKHSKNIPFLPYEESARITKLIFPQNGQMPVKYEVCEARKSQQGWELLLPAGEYTPFENSSPINYLYGGHSRIAETWGKKLFSFFDISHPYARGYFLQLSDGSKNIIVGNEQQKTDMLNEIEKKYGVHPMKNKPMDSIVLDQQIGGSISADADILKSSGISEKEINFFKHWKNKILIEKQPIYGRVSDKLDYLQYIVDENRTSKKSSQ